MHITGNLHVIIKSQVCRFVFLIADRSVHGQRVYFRPCSYIHSIQYWLICSRSASCVLQINANMSTLTQSQQIVDISSGHHSAPVATSQPDAESAAEAKGQDHPTTNSPEYEATLHTQATRHHDPDPRCSGRISHQWPGHDPAARA